MRRFGGIVVLGLVLFAGLAQAALTFPPLSGRVVDQAHMLSAATVTAVSDMLADHERATGNQIVVATLSDLQGTDIADYGYQLGRAWGIGQKGKDNGALLIVVPGAHQVRIEVGYGLEGALTDATSRAIIETTILPAFRRGDFNGGVQQGVRQMIGVITGEIPAPQLRRQQRRQGHDDGGFPVELILIIIFFAFLGGRGVFWPLIFMGGMGGRGRSGGFGGGGFGGGGGGGFSGGGGSFGGGGASGNW